MKLRKSLFLIFTVMFSYAKEYNLINPVLIQQDLAKSYQLCLKDLEKYNNYSNYNNYYNSLLLLKNYKNNKNLNFNNLKLLNDILIAKNKLKNVSEDKKNTYAKKISLQRDFYNAQRDLRSFINKLHLSQGVLFKNNTDQIVIIKLILKELNNSISEKYIEKYIVVEPNEFYILDQDQKTKLIDLKIDNQCAYRLFLNPKWTIDSHVQITIEDTEDRNFLHQYHPFNFKTKPFATHELYGNNQEAIFKRQFNDHLEYVDKILAPEEGLSLAQIDAKRNNLYQKNNISKILDRDKFALDRYENKIPLITHKIWVTSDSKPISIPNYYIKWFENCIKHNPTSQGWQHFLWIENKSKLPELAKKLENHPNIKIMELDKDLPFELVTGDAYKKAIKDNKFGKATDIIRLEILRQFGGYYLDTDYEVYQSLKPYSKVYDSIVALEPMSALICNAFIAARPEHEVINKALELINRNLNYETSPNYIKYNTDNGWKTIIETGPALLTIAHALASGKACNTDIVLPPMLIYPTVVNKYPYKDVVKPNTSVAAESIGGHYWETAWMKAEFGSQG